MESLISQLFPLVVPCASGCHAEALSLFRISFILPRLCFCLLVLIEFAPSH
jgi:hypothetical protein